MNLMKDDDGPVCFNVVQTAQSQSSFVDDGNEAVESIARQDLSFTDSSSMQADHASEVNICLVMLYF